MTSLTLVEDAVILSLPDDFGGLEGQLTISASGSWVQFTPGPIGEVYGAAAQNPDRTGRPLMACLEPLRGTTGAQGQRQQLRFFPTADQDYTVSFQYYLHADYLNGAFPYPYGGMAHAETIKQSCLAAAELLVEGSPGAQDMAWRDCLRASVNADRKMKPQTLGYNGDAKTQRLRRDMNWMPVVTVNGVEP